MHKFALVLFQLRILNAHLLNYIFVFWKISLFDLEIIQVKIAPEKSVINAQDLSTQSHPAALNGLSLT